MINPWIIPLQLMRIRLIVNDSVQEGISHLADGLNTLKLKEKSDRIYNYHITELVSFISN
jgi:hypothetical protein